MKSVDIKLIVKKYWAVFALLLLVVLIINPFFSIFNNSNSTTSCGLYPDMPTDAEISVFYEEQKDILKQAVNICQHHSPIRLVERNIEDEFFMFYKDSIATSDDRMAVKQLNALIKRLGICTIYCSRENDRASNPLISVNFKIYQKLFGVVRSERKGVFYEVPGYQSNPDNARWNERVLDAGLHTRLSEEGWYIQ